MFSDCRCALFNDKMIHLCTGMDELVCTMVTEEGLDLAAGVEYLKEHGITDLLESVGGV